MIKIDNDKGITLIALIVTIILVLLIASIGIGTIKYNNTIENSDKIISEKQKQDYVDAIGMAISGAQLEFSTKNIDESYFEKIKEILRKSKQFDGATYSIIGYNEIDGKIYKDSDRSVGQQIGLSIITKEGYEFAIGEDLLIYDGNKIKKEDELDSNGLIRFAYNPSQDRWTNQNVKVTIQRGEGISTSNTTLQYKIGEDGNWQTYNGQLNIEKNTKIYARIADKNNNVKIKATGEVNKIDKTKPQIKNISAPASCVVTTVTAVVQDNASGIDKVIFYIKKSTENTKEQQEKTLDVETIEERTTSITFSIDPEINYNVSAKVIDRAGNVSDESLPIEIQKGGHSYAYFLGEINKGTEHPTEAGTYTYRCVNNCGAEQTTHEVKVQSIDESSHYKYICLQGDCEKIESHTWLQNTQAELCRTCELCGYQDLSHDFGNWTTTVAATCGSNGQKRRTCNDCSYAENGTIQATGAHNFEYKKITLNSSGGYSYAGESYGASHPEVKTTGSYRYLKRCKVCSKHEYHQCEGLKYNNALYHFKYKCQITYSDFGGGGTHYGANQYHHCSSCGRLSGSMDTRCDYSKSHRHYCDECYKSGSTTDTKHKCLKCGTVQGKSGGCGSHLCKCGSSW